MFKALTVVPGLLHLCIRLGRWDEVRRDCTAEGVLWGVAEGVLEGVAEGVLEAGLLLSRNVELEVLDGRLPSWNVFCLLAGDPELSGKVEFGVNWYSVLVDKHRPVFGSISSNFSTSLFTDKLFPDNVFPPVPVLYPISSQEI